MSDPGFVERLLDGASVEWVPLGDLTTIKTGQSVNKNKIASNPGEFPVINSGKEPLGFINEWNTENDPIGIASRGSVGLISWQEGKYYRGNLNYSVTVKSDANLINRYLYHLLLQMQSEIHNLCTFDGIPALNACNLKSLMIPSPCPENPKKSLAIQAEIVRILDAFTELTTELTTELDLRKKQYNHYRTQILDFDGPSSHRSVFLEKLLDGASVEWKPIKEILVRTKGTKITAAQMKKMHIDGAPVKIFAGGKTVAFLNFNDIPAKNVNRKPSIIVKSRGIIEFEYYDRPFSHKNEMWSYYSNDKDINIKYVYHILKINETYFLSIGKKMQMPQIATPDTDKFKVPIPYPDDPKKSLAIQTEIVRILNKFDTLTTSLSEGLPREIKLRQKQYEYYRNLLLNFSRPEEST